MLLLTDLCIIFNIPLLRQILGFLFFTFVPGWLILEILKLREIEFVKRIVLSIGLSITFIMLGGLAVNSIYPYLLKPLSLDSLLISFNIILFLLGLWAYWRNRSDFHIKNIFNYHIDLKGKLKFPLLIALILPLLSILGAYLMNTQQNNIITFLMLGLIPIYLIILVLLNKKISSSTYPFAIGMIGLSLLLMYGLCSNHIISYADPDMQLYVFKLTVTNSHWDISSLLGGYNTCLSVTILPTVYHNLLNINEEYVFKVIFQLLFCITPVVLYILFKKYVGTLYAFLSSFFFIAQIPFIWNMPVQPRVAIALLFFALAVFVLFEREIRAINKWILFLLFAFSIVVSHYSTTYIFVFLFLGGWLIANIIKKVTRDSHAKSILSLSIIALLFCLTFLWQSQITGILFTTSVHFFSGFAQNLNDIFRFEMSGTNALKTLGIGISKIPQYISVIVNDSTFFLVTVGVITMVWKHKTNRFENEYIILALLCECLLVGQILIPYLSQNYDTIRVYLTTLIILAPALPIGTEVVAKIVMRWPNNYAIKARFSNGFITIVLLSLFLCVTSLVYIFLSNPQLTPEPLELKSADRGAFYIYNQEVASAEWLKDFSVPGSSVYADFTADSRFIVANCQINSFNIILFTKEMYNNKMSYAMLQYSAPPEKIDETAYVYLREQNIIDNKATTDVEGDTINFNTLSNLLTIRDKIYTNGDSDVYR